MPLRAHDFESCVYASSTTPAYSDIFKTIFFCYLLSIINIFIHNFSIDKIDFID